jgi:2-polyprenyl-3-methyl-5-hydroxy-6-metoxy-1,4-benzoquinol methylase
MNAEPAVWDRIWPSEWTEEVDRCPVCGSAGRQVEHTGLCDLAFQVAPGRWNLWRCIDCRSAYLDPRPDGAHIGDAYGSYYTHDAAHTAQAPQRAGLVGLLRRGVLNDFLNARFGTRFRPSVPFGRFVFALMPGEKLTYEYGRRHLPALPASGGRLLDFGCGNGEFLALAARMGWTVEGIEPDPLAVASAQAAGLDVKCGGLEVLDGRSDAFDCITLNHVIEHVHDPEALLLACHRLLRTGGRIYIETPNIDASGHRQFGPAWRGLEPPRHLVLFSAGGIEALLRRVGFGSIRNLPATDAFPWMAEASERLASLAPSPASCDGAAPMAIEPDRPQAEFLTLGAIKA